MPTRTQEPMTEAETQIANGYLQACMRAGLEGRREKAGLPKSHLAKLIRVTSSTLSQALVGTTQLVWEKFASCCKVLDADPLEVLEEGRDLTRDSPTSEALRDLLAKRKG